MDEIHTYDLLFFNEDRAAHIMKNIRDYSVQHEEYREEISGAQGVKVTCTPLELFNLGFSAGIDRGIKMQIGI